MGLQDAGLTPVFDAVYGASAGAINATYFLSGAQQQQQRRALPRPRRLTRPCLHVATGQPEGLDLYTDHLAVGERFLSLRRYWSASPVMDLDYLLDELMASVIPLDTGAVLASPLPLVVVASSLTSLRSELLAGFGSSAELVEALKASACVPEIVGGPRSIALHGRQHQLVDAAVFEPLPVKAALRDGCTHVLGEPAARGAARMPACMHACSALALHSQLLPACASPDASAPVAFACLLQRCAAGRPARHPRGAATSPPR